MVEQFKIEQLCNTGLDMVQARIAKLHHLAAVGADQVVVLFVAKRFFVLGQVAVELVFAHQVAFQQQVEGIVYGGPAYTVFAVFHADVEFFHIKMFLARINLIEDRKPFGGFPVAFAFEEIGKDLLDFFEYLGVGHAKQRYNLNLKFGRCPGNLAFGSRGIALFGGKFCLHSAMCYSRTALLLFTLWCGISAQSQPPLPFESSPADGFKAGKLDWSAYEWRLPEVKRMAYIRDIQRSYAQLYETNAFHFVNLNGDSHPDLVYDGMLDDFNGVFVIVGTAYGMKLLSEGHSNTVIRGYKTGDRINALLVYDFPCCVQYTRRFAYYLVDAGLDSWEPVYERMYAICMQEPETLYALPIPVTVGAPGAELREAPLISDQGCSYIEADENGIAPQWQNIVACVPEGTRGLAWSSLTDAQGREWFFVEMHIPVKLDYDRLDDPGETKHYLGWIEASQLKSGAPQNKK